MTNSSVVNTLYNPYWKTLKFKCYPPKNSQKVYPSLQPLLENT